MNNYSTFSFDTYNFDRQQKRLTLHYSIDDAYHFTEDYGFDFDFLDYEETALDRALQILFFVAGVSYYKTFVPKNIEVRSGSIDRTLATFLENTYKKGLGEFWYVNQLDPQRAVTFPSTATTLNTLSVNGSGALVAVGGGKDSLVSIELLRNAGHDISTWSLGHRSQLTPLVQKIGSPHYWVERAIDPQLLGKKLPGSYNGHIPISAIFACVGVIVAILTGKKDVVMSNERSADEPTLLYRDTEINHQYSKSSEFESGFQELLAQNFGDGLRYYSLLRPLSEVQIAQSFVESGTFSTYRNVFCSCNNAFRQTKEAMSWDGTCAKCAFVYLLLSPFVPETELTALFGYNLLLDDSLQTTYEELLGMRPQKPLECVGTITESQWAMDHAKRAHPELAKFQYSHGDQSALWQLGKHYIPKDIWEPVQAQLQKKTA